MGTSVVVLFQLALMLGAPWGQLAMGGRFPGRLPVPLRIAELVQAGLLSGFALIVLVRAGLLWPEWHDTASTAIWVVVGVLVVSLIMNLITPSRWERILWAPTVAVMLVCAVVVALS